MSEEPEKRLIGYDIRVAPFELDDWLNQVRLGQSLPSEVVGILLGRARPIWAVPKDE